jgi:hypothetical protein
MKKIMNCAIIDPATKIGCADSMNSFPDFFTMFIKSNYKAGETQGGEFIR